MTEMSTISCRWSSVAVGLLACAGFAWRPAGRTQEHDTTIPAAPENPKAKLILHYYPAKVGCGRTGCHSSRPDEKEVLVCRCDEYVRWEKNDKHSDAYNVLFEERAQEMGKRLKKDVTKEESCIACHGVVITDDK